MLENLQKHSTPHATFQPNSQVRDSPKFLPDTPQIYRGTPKPPPPLFFCAPPQIGEEMSQNSFIKQYLEKQQELLQQRLEREAREAAELEGETFFGGGGDSSPFWGAISIFGVPPPSPC